MSNSHCNVLKCKNEFEGFSFKCRKCGDSFCNAHRMPEDHECGTLEAKKYLEEFEQEELDYEKYGSIYEIITSIFNVNLNPFILKYIRGEKTGMKLLGELHDFEEVNLNDYYYLAGALDKFRNHAILSYGSGLYEKSEIKTLFSPINDLKIKLENNEHDYKHASVINNELLPPLEIIIKELELMGIKFDKNSKTAKRNKNDVLEMIKWRMKSFKLTIKLTNEENNEPLGYQKLRVQRMELDSIPEYLQEKIIRTKRSEDNGLCDFELLGGRYEIFVNNVYKGEVTLNKNTKLNYNVKEHYKKIDFSFKKIYDYLKGMVFG